MDISIAFGAKGVQDIPWDTIITNIVVLVGFVASAIFTRVNIRAEVEKMKKGVVVEALQDVLFDIFKFLQSMKLAKGESELEQASLTMLSSLQKVIAYGSKEAVRIVAEFQQDNYKPAEQRNAFRSLAFYAVLIAQLKYDLTGESIAPDFCYKFFLTDYESNADKLKESINKLIVELDLPKILKSK